RARVGRSTAASQESAATRRLRYASSTRFVVSTRDPDLVNNSATDTDILAALAYYTLAPCPVVDTRDLGAPIGGPALLGQQTNYAAEETRASNAVIMLNARGEMAATSDSPPTRPST